MGRRKLPEGERKTQLNLKFKKSLLDELREKLEKEDYQITKFFEDHINNYLKK